MTGDETSAALIRQVLSAGDLSVAVLPEIGAKVVSLRRSGGREWLAAPARPLRRIPSPAGPWSNYDCSGWDECFPNVAPDADLGLADHGVLWSASWVTGTASAGADRIRTTHTAPGRHRFSRDLRVHGGGDVASVTADYRVEAMGREPLHWGWAQHPLLAAGEATRIVLPAPAAVRVEAAFANGRPSRDVDWLCPDLVLAADTSLHRAARRAVKLWFEPPLPEVVAVVREHDWLAWRVDRSTATQLGLWVNLGGWDDAGAPLHQLAVEPAFGGHDGFAEAQRHGAGPVLQPGQQHRWRIVLETGARDVPIPGHPHVIPN